MRVNDAAMRELGVKRLLTTLPVRKPSKEAFFRVHPDEAYHYLTRVIELKDGQNEFYLVEPELWDDLVTESCFGLRLMVTAVTRQGALSLWPLRLAGNDGKVDGWIKSALAAVDMATKSWCRIQADMAAGEYNTTVATSDKIPEPEWPLMSFDDMLNVAFKDRVISSMDHPVLRRLRGEI